MTSARLLFYATLMLLIGFTFSAPRDFGLGAALPWIVAAWILWALGLAYLRARHR